MRNKIVLEIKWSSGKSQKDFLGLLTQTIEKISINGKIDINGMGIL